MVKQQPGKTVALRLQNNMTVIPSVTRHTGILIRMFNQAYRTNDLSDNSLLH